MEKVDCEFYKSNCFNEEKIIEMIEEYEAVREGKKI